MFRKAISGLIGLALLAMAGSANAAVIDFSQPFQQAFTGGDFIDSNGFRFTLEEPRSTSGFLEVGATRALGGLFNANDARFAMTAIDGSLFDLASIDFARRNSDTGDTRSAERIDIIGTLGGGGFVTFTTADPLDAFSTANLPSSFVGLSSVLFDPIQNINGGANNYEFVVDNILVDQQQVPEPSTLALFAISLTGLGFVGWRRRRRNPTQAA